MFHHRLEGCTATPLAGYLKALGVFRIVAEQLDPDARGAWDGDTFVLHTRVDRDALVAFFLEDYAPAPVIGPWGARSGFYDDNSEKTAREALDRLAAAEGDRFEPFKQTVAIARALLTSLGLRSKKDLTGWKGGKVRLMRALRNELPDEALRFFDACFVLRANGGEDEPSYPALLGTGGNEGSGSYTSNYTQAVVAALVDRDHDGGLSASLFGGASDAGGDGAMAGHFEPTAAMSFNGSSLGDGTRNAFSAWDLLLTVEGTLLFAAGCGRISEHAAATLTAPWAVRSAAVGSASLVAGEDGRDELWVPMWGRPVALNELSQLFAEGRIGSGATAAQDGLGAAVVIARHGAARGLDAFQRYAIIVRNGLSNVAVPAERIRVSERPLVGLLADIEPWLAGVRRAARDPKTTPGSVGRAVRRVEEAVWAFAVRGDVADGRRLWLELAAVERAFADSLAWSTDPKRRRRTRPVPRLSSTWLEYLGESTPEFRLALSFAATHLRSDAYVARGEGLPHTVRAHIVPMPARGKPSTFEDAPGRIVVWREGRLVDSLLDMLARRSMAARKLGLSGWPDVSAHPASLSDIAAFIEGRVDDDALQRWCHALCLVDLKDAARLGDTSVDAALPPALFAAMRLAHTPWPLRDVQVPIAPEVLALGAAGDGRRVGDAALRRLRGSGIVPRFDGLTLPSSLTRRATAALAFPIAPHTQQRLLGRLTWPHEADATTPTP